ncbi:hypothetical protein CPC08DRAFT_381225 [Agrocybe pediades]|nr:hypothetical protein CPC08DRAFT_381225 [Agrocybe pediades]
MHILNDLDCLSQSQFAAPAIGWANENGTTSTSFYTEPIFAIAARAIGSFLAELALNFMDFYLHPYLLHPFTPRQTMFLKFSRKGFNETSLRRRMRILSETSFGSQTRITDNTSSAGSFFTHTVRLAKGVLRRRFEGHMATTAKAWSRLLSVLDTYHGQHPPHLPNLQFSHIPLLSKRQKGNGYWSSVQYFLPTPL